MKQLNFFEAMGVQVLDAAQHEKNVKENKRKAAQATNEKRAAAAEEIPQAIVEPKPRAQLDPTFEVHFFDKDGAQRIEWYRAKDEEIAKVKCRKDYGTIAKVFYVTHSKRTLEEIEALD
jgi:hypothetical protein